MNIGSQIPVNNGVRCTPFILEKQTLYGTERGVADSCFYPKISKKRLETQALYTTRTT